MSLPYTIRDLEHSALPLLEVLGPVPDYSSEDWCGPYLMVSRGMRVGLGVTRENFKNKEWLVHGHRMFEGAAADNEELDNDGRPQIAVFGANPWRCLRAVPIERCPPKPVDRSNAIYVAAVDPLAGF